MKELHDKLFLFLWYAFSSQTTQRSFLSEQVGTSISELVRKECHRK
jgi:hypothetical protein